MTQIFRRSALSVSAIVLSCITLPAVPSRALLAAQTAPDLDLRRVIDVQLKPDRIADWTRLHREEMLPALKKGGLPWLDVWTSAAAGNPYMRTLVSPVTASSEIDFAGTVQRALGTEKGADLMARNRDMVAGVQSYIMRVRPDLGFGTPASARSIGVLSTVTVANGRTAEFETLLKTSVADSLKEANVGSYLVLQVLFGGDPNQYRTVLSFRNVEAPASGHPNPLVYLAREQHQIELGAVARQANSPVAHLERTIITYLGDLSYRPE
jgi:hypothetical protein